nr:keywimysin-related RiPP [Streptomyces cupreus]
MLIPDESSELDGDYSRNSTENPWAAPTAADKFKSQGILASRTTQQGGVVAVRIYERPTLTAIGSFKKLTGLGGQGPKDVLFRHQLL